MQAALDYISDRNSRMLPPPLWLPTLANRRFRAARARLDEVVYSIIARRRREGGEGEDLLSFLMATRDEDTGESMNDLQLRDEVMTFFLAGHDTTANSLTWTWYLLSTHPQVARRLRAELDEVLGGRSPSFEDLPRLTYTNMVIQESMRLYPPAWMFGRRAVAADVIGGYPIPANAQVMISPYIIHHHPDLWDNPEGFDPDRFLPERVTERHKFAYIPFSAGRRQCIGNHFAMMEAQLVLATVAQHVRLDLVPGHPVEKETMVTLCPLHGMKMVAHPAERQVKTAGMTSIH